MTNAQFPSSIAIFAWEVGDGGDKLVKGGGRERLGRGEAI